MVPNNGTLSEALVRPEGCRKSRPGTHRQVIVGHRLVQAHLEATIVVTAGFWHSCCWWAPPTPARFARFLPSHYAAKTPLRRRGIC